MEPLIAISLIVWTHAVELKDGTRIETHKIVAHYPTHEECEVGVINYIKKMPGNTASCIPTASIPKPIK